MRRILVTGMVVIAGCLALAPRADAEAILTLSGLGLQAGPNGELQLNVDVDLAGAAPNLVSVDLDVLHSGLTYVSHTIGSAFEVDGDPLTAEYFDATSPDPSAARQNVLTVLDAPFQGGVTGRLFSMNFLVSDPAALSLSLLGFPLAELFDGNFRSESLVSEVAPFDLQAVPFVILLTSSAPGQVTMRLTTPGTDPPDPPTSVPEPTTLMLTSLGLLAVAAVERRRRHA